MRTSKRIISSLILTLVLSFFLVNSSYAQIGSGALKCDGVDDFVTILDANGDFDLGSSMTIEAMVRHDSYTGLGSAVGGDSGMYSLGQGNGGFPAFTISIPSTNSAFGPDQLPLASWVHLAGTYDGTDIKVYVNGTLAGTTSHPGTTSGISEIRFCRFSVGSIFLDGAIDEVRIWNIVRTEQEISATKSVALNGNEAGLVGYYQFEEGSGQDVLDSSAGGNHGVLGATNLVESDDPTRETAIAPATFTINGTVSGLGPNSLTLQNNLTDDLVVSANGVFVFDTALPDGSPYDVTVLTQPTGQTCDVTNGLGIISNTDVLGVDVDCLDDVVPPLTPTVPIPTLSEWALILLTMLIGLLLFSNRKRLF